MKKNNEENNNSESPLYSLPTEIVSNHIEPHLNIGDLGAAAQSCKKFHTLFSQKLIEDKQSLDNLLLHVARGEKTQAEQIIQQNPSLLLYKSDVTDYSRRTFNKITAFQYALWALDSDMWQMIKKHLPRDKAKQQLQELESQGTAHGKHYNYEELTNALNKYIENAPVIRQEANDNVQKLKQETEHQLQAFWCEKVSTLDEYQRYLTMSRDKQIAFWSMKDPELFVAFNEIKLQPKPNNHKTPQAYWCETIGMPQRNVPAHVAQRYCHPSISFSREDLRTKVLTRNNKMDVHYSPRSNQPTSWYPLSNGDEGLGYDFAIWRGEEENAYNYWEAIRWTPHNVTVDREGLTAYFKLQVKLYNDLKENLLNIKSNANENETPRANNRSCIIS